MIDPADIIDLSEQLDEIRSRYPEYGYHPQSSIDAAALRGHPQHNPHGVIEPSEIIKIELQGQKRWWAEIRLARTPDGNYTMSTSFEYPSGGASSAPSVWDRKAYHTREAAMECAFNELIRGFEGARDWKGTTSHSEPVLAQKMVEHLQTLKGGTRQMSLF
jgi:hypothetical protein